MYVIFFKTNSTVSLIVLVNFNITYPILAVTTSLHSNPIWWICSFLWPPTHMIFKPVYPKEMEMWLVWLWQPSSDRWRMVTDSVIMVPLFGAQLQWNPMECNVCFTMHWLTDGLCGASVELGCDLVQCSYLLCWYQVCQFLVVLLLYHSEGTAVLL